MNKIQYSKKPEYKIPGEGDEKRIIPSSPLIT